jgi:glycosyltransferase involved in cell wall biosynthesis
MVRDVKRHALAFDCTYLEDECTGQSRVAYELLKEVVSLAEERGNADIRLVSFSGDVKPEYKMDRLRVERIGLGPHIAVWGHFFRAINLAARISPAPSSILWLTPERYGGDMPGVKQVVVVHDLASLRVPHAYPKRSRWLRLASLRRIREGGCSLIAISHSTKEDLVRMAAIPPERITVCHNGVSSQFVQITDQARLKKTAQALGLEGKNFFLFVGRPGSRKNVPLLLKAFRSVISMHNEPVYLAFVGPSKGDLQKLIGEAGFTEEQRSRVLQLGRISNDHLVDVYNLTRGLVFPTLYEGFGLPVAEAMACGAPVISSNCSSIPEVAGTAGILVNPRVMEPWRDAMLKLLLNPSLGVRMKSDGIEHAKNFKWRSSAEKIMQLLEVEK